jgi:hypothetical protein
MVTGQLDEEEEPNELAHPDELAGVRARCE